MIDLSKVVIDLSIVAINLFEVVIDLALYIVSKTIRSIENYDRVGLNAN